MTIVGLLTTRCPCRPRPARRGLNYSMEKQEDHVLESLSVFAIKHIQVGPDPNREDYCSHAKNHSSMLRLTT